MGLSRKKESTSHQRDKMDKSQKSETQTKGHIIAKVKYKKQVFCSSDESLFPKINILIN